MIMLSTIDLSRFDADDQRGRSAIIDAVGAACTDIGFLCVRGHGVDPAVIEAMRRTVVETFAQPDAVKRRFRVRPETYRGYIPMSFFTPNAAGRTPDRYEGFKLHVETAADDPICAAYPLYGPNVWPPTIKGMRPVVLAYWHQVDRLADILLRAMALALGLDEPFFLPFFRQPLTNMTLLHYPATAPDKEGSGIHPHKDSSAFTIIYPDPVGGLMVRDRDRQWHEAVADDGTFVINIGDVMEHWSGGRFVSTPHEVVNRSGKERYAFPYFATPRFDTVVEPVVDCVGGYCRPPIAMGSWQKDIVRSNWPDAEPIAASIDPGNIAPRSSGPS